MKQTLHTLLLLLLLTMWGSKVSAAYTTGTETPSIKFEDNAITIKEGEEDSNHGQEGTLCDEDGWTIGDDALGTLRRLITYSHVGDDIFEEFDEESGQFTLKKGSFGTATITARFAGSDTYGYLPCEASYTVTYRAYKPLLFSVAQVDVRYGEEASLTKPTLVDSDGKEVDIDDDLIYPRYTSSNESVATVSDDGTVELHSLGTTIITITADDNNNKELTASYTLNYKKAQPMLSSGLNDPLEGLVNPFDWVAGPVFTPYVGDKALAYKDYVDRMSYKSQDTSVAEVDESSGYLRFMGEGTTTITVTYAGTDRYESASTSYTVKTTDPMVETTFDFSNPARYGYGVSSAGSSEGDIASDGKIVEREHIEITCPTTSTTPNRFHSASGSTNDVALELHATTTLKVSVGECVRISNITVHGTKGSGSEQTDWTISDWTLSDDKSSATATIDDDVRINSLTIDYHLRQVTASEDEYSYNYFKDYADKPMNAKLKRTLVGGKWNTLSLPFDTEIKGSPLEGAIVKKLGSVKDNVIHLVDADYIKAGYPYLVKPAETLQDPTFNSVVVRASISKEFEYYDHDDFCYFVGNVNPMSIGKSFSSITSAMGMTFWGVTSEGKLAKIKIKSDSTTIKGLRAYFAFKNSATVSATALLDFDGETTGINGIETARPQNNKVYNLSGQYVGNNLEALPSGIYIVNGKKVVK